MTDVTKRHATLRLILTTRRREIQTDLDGRIRKDRADGSKQGFDELEHSEADTQGDITLALVQMKVETLARIDAALVRVDTDQYGSCAECECEISERRLQALPFAVRCQSCEEHLEQEQAYARIQTRQNASLSVFSELRS